MLKTSTWHFVSCNVANGVALAHSGLKAKYIKQLQLAFENTHQCWSEPGLLLKQTKVHSPQWQEYALHYTHGMSKIISPP